MLILLPPSEGKNQADGSDKFSLTELSFAGELSSLRAQAIRAYDPALLSALAAPAISIYSGVLYQALDWQSLGASAKIRGAHELLIISALYGVLRPDDSIVDYKAKISTSFWKKTLTRVLDPLEHEVIVDARSSTYSAVWTPDPSITVAVRVFQEKNGKRSVITHMSKKYRGELTRLLIKKKRARSPHDVFAIAQESYTCELTPPAAGKPWFLDLIIPGE
jgi:hypothetical protein